MSEPIRERNTPGTEAYERRRAYAHAYYQAHRNEIIAKTRQWDAEHKEHARQMRKASSKRARAKIIPGSPEHLAKLEKRRKYRAEHKAENAAKYQAYKKTEKGIAAARRAAERAKARWAVFAEANREAINAKATEYRNRPEVAARRNAKRKASMANT